MPVAPGKVQQPSPAADTAVPLILLDAMLELALTSPDGLVVREVPVVLPNGHDAKNSDGSPHMVSVMDAGDSGIYLRGSSKSQVNIWCNPLGSGEVWGYRTDQKQTEDVRKAVTPIKNADSPREAAEKIQATIAGVFSDDATYA